MLYTLRPFVVSLLIGLLIGIERERSLPKGSQAMGVRTFVLLALIGTLAAWLDQLVFTIALSVFALSAILLGYFRSTAQYKDKIGLTTELSACLVYCLGYITVQDPLLAAILGAIVLVLLLARKRLHTFSRDQIKPKEIKAAVIILLASLGILPFLPNHTIDPWQLFNPQRLAILVIIIASIQFGGYIAIRIFGEKIGMALMGFLGGLISSIAVLATIPQRVRENPELDRVAASSVILATVASLGELLVIVGVISSSLFLALLPIVTPMLILGILIAYLLEHKSQKINFTAPSNPLDIKAVLRISFFIILMITLAALANRYFGSNGVQAVSFLGGFFELRSISLANAILFSKKIISNSTALIALSLAILTSYITKFILLWTLARNRFAVITSLGLLAMLIAGVLGYLLMIYANI